MQIPTASEFEQVVAEAVHRIGRPMVETYLIDAADRFGWPIRAEYRLSVGTGLALLVQSVEQYLDVRRVALETVE